MQFVSTKVVYNTSQKWDVWQRSLGRSSRRAREQRVIAVAIKQR